MIPADWDDDEAEQTHRPIWNDEGGEWLGMYPVELSWEQKARMLVAIQRGILAHKLGHCPQSMKARWN